MGWGDAGSGQKGKKGEKGWHHDVFYKGPFLFLIYNCSLLSPTSASELLIYAMLSVTLKAKFGMLEQIRIISVTSSAYSSNLCTESPFIGTK